MPLAYTVATRHARAVCPEVRRFAVAKTFMQMASEAMAAVPSVSPHEARKRLQDDPDTLLIDVRDLDMIRETGMAEGAIPISNGALPLRARFHWLTAKRSAIIQTSPAHVGRCVAPCDIVEHLLTRMVRRPEKGDAHR